MTNRHLIILTKHILYNDIFSRKLDFIALKHHTLELIRSSENIFKVR